MTLRVVCEIAVVHGGFHSRMAANRATTLIPRPAMVTSCRNAAPVGVALAIGEVDRAVALVVDA